MVGLSGGKDSWALLQILDVLRQRAPITFSLVAVNVDSGYEGYEHERSPRPARRAAGNCHIEHTRIGEAIDDILEDERRRRARCARASAAARCTGLRPRCGATKIALGHHADDFIETLLLNAFLRRARSRPCRASLVSDDRRHVVIRPLVYVTEAEARQYAKASELPIIGCCCPACGDLSLQRQRVKRLIAELEVEHPGIKSSMLQRARQRRAAASARSAPRGRGKRNSAQPASNTPLRNGCV